MSIENNIDFALDYNWPHLLISVNLILSQFKSRPLYHKQSSRSSIAFLYVSALVCGFKQQQQSVHDIPMWIKLLQYDSNSVAVSRVGMEIEATRLNWIAVATIMLVVNSMEQFRLM